MLRRASLKGRSRIIVEADSDDEFDRNLRVKEDTAGGETGRRLNTAGGDRSESGRRRGSRSAESASDDESIEEEEEEDTRCRMCGGADDSLKMLLCDG